MSIGKNVKKFRKAKDMTQVQLAEIANISRSYLGDVEGDRYNPSVDTLKAISEALGVNVSEIIESPGNEANYKNEKSPDSLVKESRPVYDIEKMAEGDLEIKGRILTAEQKEFYLKMVRAMFD